MQKPLIAAIIKIVLVYSMVPAVLAGHTIRLELFGMSVDFHFLNVDTAGIAFACSASTLWLLTSIYSVGYMRGHQARKIRRPDIMHLCNVPVSGHENLLCGKHGSIFHILRSADYCDLSVSHAYRCRRYLEEISSIR